MIRLLFLVFIILAVGAWLRRFLRADDTAPGPARQVLDSMVRCGHCRLYVPLETAIRSPDDRFFCCVEHARQALPGDKAP